MRQLAIIFLFSFAVFSCNRTTQNASGEGNSAGVEDAPEIKFDEITHDFGKLTEGDIVKYPFKFKNIGKSPLIIQDVTVGCGCTVASKPNAPIPVGASSQIVVQFNSTGKSGPQKKFVTIMTNAIPERSILSFTAEVLHVDKK